MRNALVLAGIAACLGGCYAPGNDRLAVNHIETLETDGGIQEPVADYRPLQTVSRRDWAGMRYVVPVDSTQHSPTYAGTIEWTDKTARERGGQPTIESAYEMSAASRNQQQTEALAAPFVGFVQALAILPRMFMDHPDDAHESPEMAYQRSAVIMTRRSPIREALPDETDEPSEMSGG